MNLNITHFLRLLLLALLPVMPGLIVSGQAPSSCATISFRANSNGQANTCPNVNGTAYASNFSGTPYANVPTSAKTGNLQFNYPGATPGLLPYAITRVWLTGTGTTIQSVAFGPASPPVVVGGNTQVNYCFYGMNLATVGTLSFELTDPQTGIALGVCSYDASCSSGCGTVANPVSVLPVRFSSFTAVADSRGAVRLEWITAQEENNKGFAIERCAGDSVFSVIGFVPDGNPGGNSSTPTDYSFADADLPMVESVKYRLRQEDLDGRVSYSSTRLVQLGRSDRKTRIYSLGKTIKISFPPEDVAGASEICVYHPDGKLVRRENVRGLQELSLGGFLTGLYCVSVRRSDAGGQAVKLIYIP